MFDSHEGTLQLKHKFQKTYNWLDKSRPLELIAKRGTYFTAKVEITQKGPHAGEKVIRFVRDNKEYARAYPCCWGRYYNCNRTRIGMVCTALDGTIA